jgi:hypothetical protein
MTISEWWVEYDMHMEQLEQINEPKKYAGKLKRADVDDLKAWMDKSDGRTRD